MSVAVILIERERFRRQATWATHDRLSLPLALAGFTGMRCVGRIEINVVHSDKIQKPIAIEIDEGATRAPARLGRKQSPFFGFILERAVPQISIENILPPLRNEQVRVPMIVDVSDAYSLSPSGLPDP